MPKQRSFGFLGCLAFAANIAAQSAPSAYTVTQVNSMFGSAVTQTIYRDGSKAVVDRTGGARTLYDLDKHTTYSWDPKAPATCGSGTFSGDWGDPFASSAEIAAELKKQNAQEVGAEAVNGMAARVFEAAMPGAPGKVKVWVDAKQGFVLKLEMAGKPMLEIKQISLSAPPASVFALPSGCAAPAAAPNAPTEQGDFANAIMPPASANACTVVLRVVSAGSMQPVANVQVAVDKTVDLDHPAHYTMGMGANGHATFGGGGLREETAQMRDGALRIENAPKQFDVEIAFGKAGSASALIYRQCFAPETVLLFRVKNPDKISDGGDWLWVKSGKFAH